MSFCTKCMSTRVATVTAKTDNQNNIVIIEKEHTGFIPRDMNVGGGNYLHFTFCMECGQLQGSWPLKPTNIEISGDVKNP